MKPKGLFIWVEGQDDEMFFKNVFKPEFLKHYDYVKIIEHAEKSKQEIKEIQNAMSISGADYIFTRDLNTAPCVSSRRAKIISQGKYSDFDSGRISIIIRVIESWYLAGLIEEKFRIAPFKETNDFGKDQFNKSIPKKYNGLRIPFMQDILKSFSLDIARQKNKSFDYFCSKFLGNMK